MDRTCLDCGIVIPRGIRCARHSKIKERIRNAQPRRQAYRDPAYKSYVKDTKCAICGATEGLTKDHRIPLIKGGNNAYDNLQTLCIACNSAKGGYYV